MNKIGIIIAREFNERVRKKSFIISTLLMPILMLGMMAAPTLMMLFAKGEHKQIIVLDDSLRIAERLTGDEELEFLEEEELPEEYRPGFAFGIDELY